MSIINTYEEYRDGAKRFSKAAALAMLLLVLMAAPASADLTVGSEDSVVAATERAAPTAGQPGPGIHREIDTKTALRTFASTLTVTIQPAGAAATGQWKYRYGDTPPYGDWCGWFESGHTEGFDFTAEFEIEFSDLSDYGYDKPENITFTADHDGAYSQTGTYARRTGTLNVNIDAGGSGGSFSISGPADFAPVTDRTTNYSAGVPTGDYTVTFSAQTGYTLGVSADSFTVGANQASGNIAKDAAETVTGAYTRDTGTLNVNIDAGGSGGSFSISGPADFAPVTDRTTNYSAGVPTGDYTVTFSAQTGYTLGVSADSFTVGASQASGNIAKETAETVTGAYTRDTGTLNVNIDAGGSGGSFSISGPADFTPVTGRTGNYSAGVPTGDYTVTFSAQTGYTLGISADSFTVGASQASGTMAKDAAETVTGAYTRDTGTLNVNIDAGGSGGSFSISGPADFAPVTGRTGNYSAGVPTGSYAVTFSEQINYTLLVTANPFTVTGNTATGEMVKGATETVTGIYTQHTGSLQVTIEPQGARDAGAQWRVDGGAWQNSGATVSGLAVGSHSVDFKDIANWDKPAGQTVTTLKDQTTTTTGAYTQHTGSLQVTIEPQGARDAGAQWRVDGGAWQNSGATAGGLIVGSHAVEFKQLTNWDSPAALSINISKNQTSRVSTTYYQHTGWLRVTINPQGARDAGAQWRIAGGAWQNSGATLSLEVGDYTVQFKDVADWDKPANLTVTITRNQTTQATGTYAQQTGSLRVTIQPQEAALGGGMWRRVGTQFWRGSGNTETGILVGQVEVEFSTIDFWNKPANKTVTITKGATATATGAYTHATGSLRVNIGPQAAIDAGARWRIKGTSAWRNSGFFEIGVQAGYVKVEFKEATGWTTPDDMTVTLYGGEVKTASATYARKTGSLQVNITPQEAVDAGAKWQRAGTGTGVWRDSGFTETNVPIGTVTVTFKPLSGWTQPSAKQVTINEGQTTVVTAKYTKSTGSLQVTIEPAGAREDGAKWRRYATSTWRDSGFTETNVPLGDHYIEYKETTKWQPPDMGMVKVKSGQTAAATGAYTRKTGSLNVTIYPSDVWPLGAKWKRTDADDWRGTGETEAGVPTGPVTVEFKDVVGWNTPANQTATIEHNQTTSITAGYLIVRKGRLKVTIEPSEVNSLGAKWALGEGGLFNRSSGAVLELDHGRYVVIFKPIRGYITPDPLWVDIPQGQLVQITGIYKKALVGDVWIQADNYDFTTTDLTEFTASGNVKLAFQKASSPPGEAGPSGFSSAYIVSSSDISANTNTGIITGFGSLTTSGVDLPLIKTNNFYNGRFYINCDTLKTDLPNTYVPAFLLAGWNVEILNFEFLPDVSGVALELNIVFPEDPFSANTYAYIERIECHDGKWRPEVVGYAHMDGFYLFTEFIYIGAIELLFDTIENTFAAWIEGVKIKFLPGFGAFFSVKEGKLERLLVDAWNLPVPGVPIPGLVGIRRLYFDLSNPSKDQTYIEANVVVGIFPEAAELVRVDVWGFLYPSAFMFGWGNATALGYEGDMTSIYAEAFYDGPSRYVYFYGYAQFLWGLIKGNLTVDVKWVPVSFWNAYIWGSVGFSVPDWIADLIGADHVTVHETYVNVNRESFDAHVILFWGLIDFDVHYDAAWAAPPGAEPKARVTVRAEKVTLSGASPASRQAFTVRENAPSAVFVARGELQPPDVVLILPDGGIIDPSGDMPRQGPDFVYRSSSERNSTAFAIRDPMPGEWTVEVRNADAAGRVDLYFHSGNSEPAIAPKKVEKIDDALYRLHYKAVDPDDEAVVEFFWSRDNKSFSGIPIGEATESDGAAWFDWQPDASLPKSGYVLAKIDDGRNSPRFAYFEESVFLGRDRPAAPRIRKCRVRGEDLLVTASIADKGDIESLRVYFTDDLKDKKPTTFATMPASSTLNLCAGLLKPGRKYSLSLAAVDFDGVESKLGRRKVVDYRLTKGNNHPFITSEPDLEAEAGALYTYNCAARDYDGDPLRFSLFRAPEGMAIDPATGVLTWNPTEAVLGTNLVSIKVEDGRGGDDLQEFVLRVGSPAAPTRTAALRIAPSNDGPQMLVSVIDHLAGADAREIDHLPVIVSYPGGIGATEITLRETAADSHVFEAMLPLREFAPGAPPNLVKPNQSLSGCKVTWKDRNGEQRKAKANH